MEKIKLKRIVRNSKTMEWILLVLLIILVILMIGRSVESLYDSETIKIQREVIEEQNKKLQFREPFILPSIDEKRLCQLQPRLDPITAKRIIELIKKYCKQYNLNESLVVHLMYRESSFDVMSVSNKDCYGLMQVRYSVHKEMLKELNIQNSYQLFHLENNIESGCKILKEYLDKSETLYGALQRYVGGEHDKYIKDIFRLMVEYEMGRG